MCAVNVPIYLIISTQVDWSIVGGVSAGKNPTDIKRSLHAKRGTDPLTLSDALALLLHVTYSKILFILFLVIKINVF